MKAARVDSALSPRDKKTIFGMIFLHGMNDMHSTGAADDHPDARAVDFADAEPGGDA